MSNYIKKSLKLLVSKSSLLVKDTNNCVLRIREAPFNSLQNPRLIFPTIRNLNELLPRNLRLRNAFTVDWSEIEVKGAVDARTGEQKRMVV
ncbi:hypothetical protein YC2023_035059 [Brassica napus]